MDKKLAKVSPKKSTKLVGDWALPSLWVMKYRCINGSFMRFTSRDNLWAHRPWQISPINDMSPIIAVKKARQVGFTEVFICSMFYMATLLRSRTVYTLPKVQKAQEVAKGRIDPVGIPGHPNAFKGAVLDQLRTDWRSTLYKKIRPKYGGGFSEILITGSWNEDLGESTAADQVFLDEYDRMRPGVITAFRESLSSSRINKLRVFSTPTFPKAGIDSQYLSSDQRRWHYKCPRCGEWQHLTRQNIVQRSGPLSLIQRLEARDETVRVPDGTFAIVCISCLETLDRYAAKCEWVPEVKNAEIRGYQVSQLDCVWHSADSIMRKLKSDGLSKWLNYVLAEAYLGSAKELPENFVYRLVAPDLSIHSRSDFDRKFKSTQVAIGVDWGSVNWAFVLGITPDHPNPILLEPYSFRDTDDPDDTIKEVVELAKRWSAGVVVADFGYGQDRNPRVYKHLDCQFWGCLYPPNTSQRATEDPIFGVNKPSQKSPFPLVQIGRTPSLKARLFEVFSQGLTIPNNTGWENALALIDVHFRNIAISEDELADGSPIEVAHTLGADHFLHAYNYAYVGLSWLRTHSVKVYELDAISTHKEVADLSYGLPTPDDLVDLIDLF